MYIDYIRLEWEKVSKRSYLQRIPSIRKMDGLRFNAPVTFFVGENGSGKSTLLEAIAVAYGFNPEGGSYNYRFSTFDDHSNLHNAVVLGRGRAGTPHGFFLRAESFY
ncbi:MAG: AAA family ATPase, partial [Bacteroidales bacterium]|nr:AAA family ATPase [Bacteroidales bacterium]